MDKSYVTLEQQRCLVCGKDFDTGALLLDRRLKNRFDMHTVTGMGLCQEHQELYDNGYIALVGIDPEKSHDVGGDASVMKFDDAYRTGRVAHLKADAWPKVMSAPLPERDGKMLPFVFVEDEVIDLLAQMQERA